MSQLPPPPPPSSSPPPMEYPEPELPPIIGEDSAPRKKKPLVLVLLILLGVLVLGGGGYFAATKFGLIPGFSLESKTSAPAPTSSSPAVETGPSQSPTGSADASATSSATASASSSPSETGSSAPAVGQWSSGEPTESPSETESTEPSEGSAASNELSAKYCNSGELIALAVTDKHRVSICDGGTSLYYRGESLSSGDTIWLDAARAGGNSFTAVNPGSTDTIYKLSESNLKVSVGSKVLVDAPVNSFTTYD